jgi:hypothetical protein
MSLPLIFQIVKIDMVDIITQFAHRLAGCAGPIDNISVNRAQTAGHLERADQGLGALDMGDNTVALFFDPANQVETFCPAVANSTKEEPSFP